MTVIPEPGEGHRTYLSGTGVVEVTPAARTAVLTLSWEWEKKYLERCFLLPPSNVPLLLPMEDPL